MSRRTMVMLVLAGWMGISGCRKAETPPSAAPAIEPRADVPVAEQELEQLSADDLAPTIRALGGFGLAPTEIVVELARPIVTADKVDKPVDEGTILRLDPPLDGELRYRSTSALAFRPAAPFPASSTITATLESVATRFGVIEAPGATAWSAKLEIPAFGMARAAVAAYDADRRRLEVDLFFTDAVNPDQVARRLAVGALHHSGARSNPTVKVARMSPTTVRATLQGGAIGAGAQVELAVDEGVPAERSKELKAAKFEWQTTLPEGPRLQVKAVLPVETGSGFAVDVICDDQAVETRRWYWDNVHERSFGRISSRCTPREDQIRELVAIDPPIPFSVTAAGGGFRILAAFERGVYAVRLASGLGSNDGGTLVEEILETLVIPARSPKVSFGASGRYLPRAAWRSLALRHMNVSTIELEIRRVPPENLVFWMSGESEAADERTSDLVLRHQLAVQSPGDELTTTFLDVGALLPADTRGLLELRARGASATDAARIVLTDLQLIAKRIGVSTERPQGTEVIAWAIDSRTLAPERAVEIKLVKPSGTAVATCRTGGDGRCRLAMPPAGVDPTAPIALVAVGARDLSYLEFQDLEVEVQEERVAGEPWASEAQYRAAVWPERGVYRPGETVHLAALVRTDQGVAPEAKLPTVLSIVDPRGRLILERTLETNAAGYLTHDQAIADFAPTGRWEARLSAGGRKVGSAGFAVEEFVPERLAVEAKARAEAVTLGQAAELDISARYLFGGVPADHQVELSCDLEPARFTPKGNANFHYGVWSDSDSPGGQSLGRVSGTLDAEGRTTLSCGDAASGFAGPATLVARAAVFESGSGRTTVGRASVPVHPESFYLGLASSTKTARAGEPVVINGVVVDWGGALVSASRELELEVLRIESEWGWSYDQRTGEENWRRLRRAVPDARRELTAQGGTFSFEWTPESDAEAFVVRARATGTRARTDLELEGSGWSWWGWETEQDLTPRPDAPTWVALEAPSVVRAGEGFEVSFEAPWRGRALLALETDRLVRSEWRDIETGKVTWKVAIDQFQPTVYASVLVVKDPHAESSEAFVPDRAFGVVALAVEPTAYQRRLELAVPKEVRSGVRLAVGLDLGASDQPTWATVAVVDEGILSLTRYQSPNPFDAVFARRALGVETFETIGWTLLAPSLGSRATTGGDAAGAAGRAQPVKPVALWSGLVEVPTSGRLEIPFELPTYRGQLRVMAVAADPLRMARADAKVTVRDPLVLQTTTPRVLAIGDRVDVPVHVTNLSGARRTVEVELTLAKDSSGVSTAGPTTQRLDLAGGATGQVVFRLEAEAAAGAGKIDVVARAGELESKEELTIPLVPAAPPERRLTRLELPTDGGRVALADQLGSWQPGTERSVLTVTSNPYADVFGHLGWLIRYPYGCLEQTTSTARPLLFLGELVRAVDPTLVARASVDDMVRAGIERVLSMQTPSGGFGYWPGAAEPASWATAYATHFLLDARAASHPVPQARIDDALEWLEGEITNRYERGVSERSWYTQDAEPYMHYVLALAGRPRKARAERLLGTLPGGAGESAEHRVMLQAALFLAGDRRYEAELRRADLSPARLERKNGWSFYSDRRYRGFLLSTMVDLFGREGNQGLADVVAEGLRGRDSGWYTTQELAWGITGLGKFLGQPSESSDAGRTTLHAGSDAIAPEKTSGAGRAWSLVGASRRTLELDVPAHQGRLWLLAATEGVATQPNRTAGGEGLRLARRVWSAAGEQLEGSRLSTSLGDLVFIELELTNLGPERVGNLALVDRVPAGWEIENPRLGREQRPEWIDEAVLWNPDHLDVRDDRLEVFGYLEPGQSRKVVYAVRAVSAGTFALPAAVLEAMYDPSRWAMTTAGTAVVTASWQGESR